MAVVQSPQLVRDLASDVSVDTDGAYSGRIGPFCQVEKS